MGGHSLLTVHLITHIEHRFGQRLPLAILFEAATIEHLAIALQEEQEEKPWSPLVPIQPHGQKPPFFCIPGAGGNVIYFYDMVRELGPDYPFYSFEARGLDGILEPHESVEEMATCYIEAMQTVQPEGPYFLGGHSFGGWIAFEMAQQLQRQGYEVALLVILNTPTPMVMNADFEDPADFENRSEADWFLAIAEVISRWSGQEIILSHRDLDPLDPNEQLSYFTEILKEINLLPNSGQNGTSVRVC